MRPLAIAVVLASMTGCHRAPLRDGAPASPPPDPATTSVAPTPADPVAALIGTKPPEWQTERWISSPPLTLASLRGSVVLVRWWTAGCPYCSATAPALRAFDRRYRERGLKVIGMYHHKEDTPFEPRVYEDTAREYEFTFPLAVDTDWRTLKSWMRDADGQPVDTGWTSVTFLLDKQGVVRHVHPGGQYLDGDAAHQKLDVAIEQLLADN